MRRWLFLLILSGGCGGGWGGGGGSSDSGSSPPPAAGSVGDYTYQLYVPPTYDATVAAPLLIALHGTGGHGSGMIALWKSLADSKGFLILAPNYWDNYTYFMPAGEAAILEMIDQIDATHDIDRKRMYLNGVSTGGTWSFVFGLSYSHLFAAASVFAGGYTGDNAGMVSVATRQIPYYLSHGVNDGLFPITQARNARDALAVAGHLVQLQEHAEGHAVAAGSPEAAWAMMSLHVLP